MINSKSISKFISSCLVIGCFAGWLFCANLSIAEEINFQPDTEDLVSSEKLNTPHSVLSGFFGKRRASMVLSGMQDLVGVTVTGLSPLIVLSVSGPVVYFLTEADQRAELIFFYQPWFFCIVIVITILVLLKDTLLSWAGWLKTPLNILAMLFHFLGFLLGYFFLYHRLMGISSTGDESSAGLYGIFLVAVMFLFYTSVWILGNCVEVLIMLSPFPFVDLVLRSIRIFLVVLMYALCWIHPVLGLLVALPIIIVSIITLERSLRLFWLGMRFIVDLICLRKNEVSDQTDRITAFNIAAGNQLPWFTLGHLTKQKDAWTFATRRFLIGPRKYYPLNLDQIVIAKGDLFPSILERKEESSRVLIRLMPAYRSQEEELGQCLGADQVVVRSIRSTFKDGWNFLWSLWRKDSQEPEQDSVVAT